ncbi:MAG: hypothetical protein QOH77_1092, partial [Actinomycetota bacterium]|nr:hypothetical protein [Actinomycetota bacterium]
MGNVDEPMKDLAARGRARTDWIRSRMPLLAQARADFAETLPFAG